MVLTQEMIKEFKPFINGLAHRYSCKTRSQKDDLMQEGYIGLMQAAKRYDPDSAASLRTFAYRRIRGAMIDYLRRFLPGSRKLNQPFKALDVISLDHQIKLLNGKPGTFHDTIGSDGETAKRRLRILCREVLTDREFIIIKRAYFDGGTRVSLCNELNLSESRIAQLHKKALVKLKEAIGHPSELGDMINSVGGHKIRGSQLVRWGKRK